MRFAMCCLERMVMVCFELTFKTRCVFEGGCPVCHPSPSDSTQSVALSHFKRHHNIKPPGQHAADNHVKRQRKEGQPRAAEDVGVQGPVHGD